MEHITHIIGFAEGLYEYHSQCSEILKDVVKQLNERYIISNLNIDRVLFCFVGA